MPDAPKAELMRSLGRLVRGLSALFWGLPIALMVCFYTARAEAVKSFGIMPPLVCAGLAGLRPVATGSFQKQERVWRNALDRAQLLSLIDFGLSPFLYWSSQVPANPFFLDGVLMAVRRCCFWRSLNQFLQRLGAMLPDEALRLEIKQFTALNLKILWVTLLFGAAYLALSHWQNPSLCLQAVLGEVERGRLWFLIVLVLLPLAMTMALLWKTKEVILDSVFGAKA